MCNFVSFVVHEMTNTTANAAARNHPITQLSWEPSRLSCELLKAQWQWPVCGSLPFRLFRLCRISACLFFCAASRSLPSCPQPCHTFCRWTFSVVPYFSPGIQTQIAQGGLVPGVVFDHPNVRQKQNSVLKNEDGGAPYKPRINHEGHKATRRKQELPSCNFVSFVV